LQSFIQAKSKKDIKINLLEKKKQKTKKKTFPTLTHYSQLLDGSNKVDEIILKSKINKLAIGLELISVKP